MKEFIAACAQFAALPMAIEENLARAVQWVTRAVNETGASLVVLPETITTGFTPDCPADILWDRVDTLPGRQSAPIAEVARRLKVYVAFPTYERGPERGVVYNSVALFTPDGDLAGVYRKTHLFPTERLAGGGWSTPGQDAVVIETPLASIGLSSCYDGDFPELYRALAIKGAEVVLRPSALLRSFEIWDMVNRARAYDNHIYMLSCNAIGPDAGGHYYFGHSMIVSPIAQTLALCGWRELHLPYRGLCG